MHIKIACSGILSQLTDLLNQLTEQEYSTPVKSLGNATLGQHLRHTLEFFTCLEKGCEQHIVNYDKREHDRQIENDKHLALAVLNSIRDFVLRQDQNIPLSLEVGYDLKTDCYVTVESNLMRELVYNIEHAVHHMAIIKIGIQEVAPHVVLPLDFGIAASTLRYQEAVPTTSH